MAGVLTTARGMRRARDSRLIASAMLMLALAACSSTKNPLPTPFKGSAVENPVSCKTLQNGQIVGKQILLDGGVPNCGASGLRCPLPGVSAGTDVCGTRHVYAECEQNRWTLACETMGDASTEGGSQDAGDAGDAAPD